MATRFEIAKVGELDTGEMKQAPVEDRVLVLLNVGGDLFAIDDECTHQACSLSDGTLDGDELECVCHGSVFDVKTGSVLEGPAEMPVPTYRVQVDAETVYVEME